MPWATGALCCLEMGSSSVNFMQDIALVASVAARGHVVPLHKSQHARRLPGEGGAASGGWKGALWHLIYRMYLYFRSCYRLASCLGRGGHFWPAGVHV